MRLLIALAGGFTAFLVAGLLLGVAPTFTRTSRPSRRGRIRRGLQGVAAHDLSDVHPTISRTHAARAGARGRGSPAGMRSTSRHTLASSLGGGAGEGCVQSALLIA